jgi:hypothetical protein
MSRGAYGAPRMQKIRYRQWFEDYSKKLHLKKIGD